MAQRATKRTEAPKGAAPPAPGSISYGTEKLPPAVIDMREAILTAVRSGRIDDLRPAIQMNELKPDFGAAAKEDPIGHFRRASGDGEGREILAILAELLDSGYTTLPTGRDPENNRLLVWPYFAEIPLDKLTPGQQVELMRLVSPAAAKAMIDAKRYTWWRLAIAADGTWHTFVKVD